MMHLKYEFCTVSIAIFAFGLPRRRDPCRYHGGGGGYLPIIVGHRSLYVRS